MRLPSDPAAPPATLIAAYMPIARLRGRPSANVVAISASAVGATIAPPAPRTAWAASSHAWAPCSASARSQIVAILAACEHLRDRFLRLAGSRRAVQQDPELEVLAACSQPLLVQRVLVPGGRAGPACGWWSARVPAGLHHPCLETFTFKASGE